MEELFKTIPINEFENVVVKNPKTREEKKQLVAVQDVYIPRIGMHRVVFVDCTKEKRPENDEDAVETKTTASGRKFRLFVTNVMIWDTATILAKYSLRWTIETSYHDMNQQLSLHGCKWRELSAQYFFIALTFLCYLFLQWAKVHGHLKGYKSKLRTVGQLKNGFIHYCQHRYTIWWNELDQRSRSNAIDKWIIDRVYASS